MPPDNFLPVMKNVLKQEANFQEKLAKLKEMPDDPKLNRQIGILYLKRQQIEKALPISEKMPDDVELNREFAIYYLGKNQFEKALLISEKMPDDVYYLGKNQFEKALLISEKMPDDVKLNNEFAMTYLKTMQIEKALPFSEKVFENDPDNSTELLPKLNLQIGLTYAMQIQRKSGEEASEYAGKAVVYFQNIIETYPKSSEYESAQYYLGVTYSLDKQFDKSIEVLEKLINHITNENLKKQTQTTLERIKALAAEAAEAAEATDEEDN
jgi:tetratricopeptide (TPR) repeat protein